MKEENPGCLRTAASKAICSAGNKGIIPFSTVKSPTTPKKGKNMAQNRPQKRTLIYSMRGETRRKRVTLLNLSWESAQQVTQIFHCSVLASAANILKLE